MKNDLTSEVLEVSLQSISLAFARGNLTCVKRAEVRDAVYICLHRTNNRDVVELAGDKAGERGLLLLQIIPENGKKKISFAFVVTFF